jgi:hypothetical protein
MRDLHGQAVLVVRREDKGGDMTSSNGLVFNCPELRKECRELVERRSW